MLDDYKEEELKERAIIHKLAQVLTPVNYQLSEIGSGAYCDFIFCYKNNRYLGEMKCRSFHSSKYSNLLLEDKKAKNLVYTAYKMGITQPPLYCMHYSDNRVAIIKLTPSLLIYYEPIWRNIGGQSKLVYLIPLSESKIIEL